VASLIFFPGAAPTRVISAGLLDFADSVFHCSLSFLHSTPVLGDNGYLQNNQVGWRRVKPGDLGIDAHRSAESQSVTLRQPACWRSPWRSRRITAVLPVATAVDLNYAIVKKQFFALLKERYPDPWLGLGDNVKQRWRRVRSVGDTRFRVGLQQEDSHKNYVISEAGCICIKENGGLM
jgi:hypothetical protein